MFSLTILTLPACSVAISSSTGATMRQGPHHSAQKSTNTGVSLAKTSVAKVSSVTDWVVPTVGSCRLSIGCAGKSAESRLSVRAGGELGSGLLGGQPPLGVESGGAAGARRGDGLAVRVIDEVAAREDTFEIGARRGLVDHHVAGLVNIDLAAEEFTARVVADCEEQASHRKFGGGTC